MAEIVWMNKIPAVLAVFGTPTLVPSLCYGADKSRCKDSDKFSNQEIFQHLFKNFLRQMFKRPDM